MKSTDCALSSQKDNPTVIAKIRRMSSGAWELKIKCPHCAKTHYHGSADGEPPYGGNRWAHRADGVAWSGYEIAVTGGSVFA